MEKLDEAIKGLEDLMFYGFSNNDRDYSKIVKISRLLRDFKEGMMTLPDKKEGEWKFQSK